MLAQQLRQRGCRAALAPGALAEDSWLHYQRSCFATVSDGTLPEAGPISSTSVPSRSPSSATASTDSNQATLDDIEPRASNGPSTAAAQPLHQASPETLAKLAALKSKLSAVSSDAGRPGVQSTGQQHPAAAPAAPAAPQAQPPQRRAPLQPAYFRGVPLLLGEEGGPLQSMAVLAHAEVSQLERYRADPAAADAAVLASLARLPPQRQEQAAATLRMAAGVPPAPALLVWAAQEVGSQLRGLLRERLAEAGAGAAALHSEPWYEGALQLARLALASAPPPPQPQALPQPQAPQQPQTQAAEPPQAQAPQPRTELQLLRAFAEERDGGAAGSGGAAGAGDGSGGAAQVPYVVQWDALVTLPQLPALLEAAAKRSPSLATTLALAGVRPAAAAVAAAGTAEAAGASGGAAVPLLPALRGAAAAARLRALEAAALVPAGQPAEAPLDADAVLTSVALGRAAGVELPPAAAAPPARAAAVEWLAAASLLRHAEERLGCAGGGGSGLGAPAVAAMQLLGLPLEPPELGRIEELRVTPEELKAWLAGFASQLAAAAAPRPGGSAAAAIAVPRAFDTRLAAARSRLAAAGRALVLAGTPPQAAAAPAGADAATAQPAAAAAAVWLRAAGAPLASALLSGGYGSLRPLRAMAPELREALLLRLLEGGRPGGGAAALAAALYGDAEGVLADARAEAAGAAGAAEALLREGIEADLDLVRERFVPPPPTALPPPPPLPSDDELAAAVLRLPTAAREVYYNHYALRPGRDMQSAAAAAPSDADGAADAAAKGDAAAAEAAARPAADAVRALLGGVGEGGVKEALELPDTKTWLASARAQLLSLPRPVLSLLLRFVRVQVSHTPESAALQRRKLLALLAAAGEQQARVLGAESRPEAEAEAEAVARELAAAAAAAGAGGGGGGGGSGGGRMPAALRGLLGEQGAAEFAGWVAALALNPAQAGLSSQDLLAAQHLAQDVERYLAMTHDPRLSLSLGGLGPASPRRPSGAEWRDPALRRSEAGWLAEMRPHLDAYLRALGHRPLGDAEWGVYVEAALAEWEAGSEARAERLAAEGRSGFFNPRADEVYLQQLLERSVPLDSPLGPSSRRYLDTLLRNPSWTFQQRLRAVQRLAQLSDHFSRQPPAPEEGSPFAPLFAPGGPDPVPRLPPLQAAAAAPQGSGGAAPERAPLRLPDGF